MTVPKALTVQGQRDKCSTIGYLQVVKAVPAAQLGQKRLFTQLQLLSRIRRWWLSVRSNFMKWHSTKLLLPEAFLQLQINQNMFVAREGLSQTSLWELMTLPRVSS